MIHNGVEYGLMQAYAEGFELMEAKKEFGLDLGKIAETWRYGSVVRSWLLDLAAAALSEDPNLERLQAYVDDSGEGRWTVQESVDLGVPAPVITLATPLEAPKNDRRRNHYISDPGRQRRSHPPQADPVAVQPLSQGKATLAFQCGGCLTQPSVQ
jgi:6-phosphogluconate dehydrogenase (decarboxylating)